MKVIKRDGSTVDFDRSKIVVAIQKANNAVDESERIAEDRIENIAPYVESRNPYAPFGRWIFRIW